MGHQGRKHTPQPCTAVLKETRVLVIVLYPVLHIMTRGEKKEVLKNKAKRIQRKTIHLEVGISPDPAQPLLLNFPSIHLLEAEIKLVKCITAVFIQTTACLLSAIYFVYSFLSSKSYNYSFPPTLHFKWHLINK